MVATCDGRNPVAPLDSKRCVKCWDTLPISPSNYCRSSSINSIYRNFLKTERGFENGYTMLQHFWQIQSEYRLILNYHGHSMYGVFIYIWLIFMVNVGKHTIHGMVWVPFSTPSKFLVWRRSFPWQSYSKAEHRTALDSWHIKESMAEIPFGVWRYGRFFRIPKTKTCKSYEDMQMVLDDTISGYTKTRYHVKFTLYFFE